MIYDGIKEPTSLHPGLPYRSTQTVLPSPHTSLPPPPRDSWGVHSIVRRGREHRSKRSFRNALGPFRKTDLGQCFERFPDLMGIVWKTPNREKSDDVPSVDSEKTRTFHKGDPTSRALRSSHLFNAASLCARTLVDSVSWVNSGMEITTLDRLLISNHIPVPLQGISNQETYHVFHRLVLPSLYQMLRVYPLTPARRRCLYIPRGSKRLCGQCTTHPLPALRMSDQIQHSREKIH